jgi:hypothetical protein
MHNDLEHHETICAEKEKQSLYCEMCKFKHKGKQSAHFCIPYLRKNIEERVTKQSFNLALETIKQEFEEQITEVKA